MSTVSHVVRNIKIRSTFIDNSKQMVCFDRMAFFIFVWICVSVCNYDVNHILNSPLLHARPRDDLNI